MILWKRGSFNPAFASFNSLVAILKRLCVHASKWSVSCGHINGAVIYFKAHGNECFSTPFSSAAFEPHGHLYSLWASKMLNIPLYVLINIPSTTGKKRVEVNFALTFLFISIIRLEKNIISKRWNVEQIDTFVYLSIYWPFCCFIPLAFFYGTQNAEISIYLKRMVTETQSL